MAIVTTRAREAASVSIDEEKCNGCGLCVAVCKDFALHVEEGKLKHRDESLFGCIACAHCTTICPHDAIKITGRTLSPSDVFDIPSRSNLTDYDSFFKMLAKRRSIREFRHQAIEKEIIEKILKAAQTAPMGIPPSDVNVLIWDNLEKSRAFVQDFCHYLKGFKWLVSPLFLNMMRPFWGEANDSLFRNFVRPMVNIFTKEMDAGNNIVTYDAPLVMYFYGSAYCDPADPIIAATYATLAAESLGLGACMIGSIHPMIQHGPGAAKFRKKHGIRQKSHEGLFVIFGYPAVRYMKGVKRSFASVAYA